MDQNPVPPSELDDLLSRVRFEPRESLGPEILGRWRAGERPTRPTPRRPGWVLLAAGLAGVLLAGGAWRLMNSPREITVDRCCQDLDGGGTADDGILVITRDGESVDRLVVYEDRDGSGAFSPGDLVRFARTGRPAVTVHTDDGVRLIESCCLDYDGGGSHDDALLVLARPPDRITMAAIYETGRASTEPLR